MAESSWAACFSRCAPRWQPRTLRRRFRLLEPGDTTSTGSAQIASAIPIEDILARLLAGDVETARTPGGLEFADTLLSSGESMTCSRVEGPSEI